MKTRIQLCSSRTGDCPILLPLISSKEDSDSFSLSKKRFELQKIIRGCLFGILASLSGQCFPSSLTWSLSVFNRCLELNIKLNVSDSCLKDPSLSPCVSM